MNGGVDDLQALMAFHQWHLLSNAEERRRIEVQTKQLRQESMLAHTKHCHFTVAGIRALGKKDNSLLQLDCFLAWSQDWQVAKNDQLRNLKCNKVIGKYSAYTLSQLTKQD